MRKCAYGQNVGPLKDDEGAIVLQTKNKKIIFVINNVNVGGAGKVLRFVANSCCEYFGKVYIISLNEKKENCKIGLVNFLYLNTRLNIKGTWRFEAIIKLRKLISSISPDVVCTFVSDISVTTYLSLIGKKTTLIAAERGDPHSLGPIWSFLTKIAYMNVDRCIFQTVEAKQYFNIRVRSKSSIIPNPYVPDGNIVPYEGKRKKTIVSVGRFVKEKGFDILIKAYAIVHLEHPEFSLSIYGDGPLRCQYDKLIKSYNLSSFVSMPGYIEDIASSIRKDGIFVLSSLSEGIPNVLLEAMSLGLPTISTNCTSGGPALLTKNGLRGILVPVGDVNALAKAIILLIENEGLSKRYSEAGLEVVAEFHPDEIKKLWIDSLFRVSEKKTRIIN